jgi:hypothetical protein
MRCGGDEADEPDEAMRLIEDGRCGLAYRNGRFNREYSEMLRQKEIEDMVRVNCSLQFFSSSEGMYGLHLRGALLPCARRAATVRRPGGGGGGAMRRGDEADEAPTD